jgi:nitrous oxidase accessory protein NosD
LAHLKVAAVLVISLILAVTVFFFVGVFFGSNESYRHGEGYQDPATAIHITPSGDIMDPTFGSSGSNITRVGNTYVLTANVSNWVIIERSNIVLDGRGFSSLSRHSLALTQVSNVTVKDLTVASRYTSTIVLQNVDHSIFQNITAGFRLINSNNNLISNCSTGIDLENSTFNTIKDCISGRISLSKSNGNSILYNSLWTQGPMLGFYDSSNNLVFGNTFEKFWWWIGIGGSSTNNKIVANNVWAGQLYLVDKLEGTNYIYHNNFYNFHWNQSANTNSANVWSSDGRGNYWANFHTGDANNDGVVDSPYVIDKTNEDDYPLTTPVDISAEPLPK